MGAEAEPQGPENPVAAQGVKSYSVEVEVLANRLAAKGAASPDEVAALWRAVQRDADALNASLDRAIAQAHRTKA